MVREHGVVVDVLNAETVRIAMDAAGHAQCGSCGICKHDAKREQVLLDVKTPTPLAVGDRVTVEIPVPGMVQSGTLLLVIPLVLFIAGIVVGEVLRGRGVWTAGNWLSVVLGLALMALAYVGVSLYDRHLRLAPEHQPRVVEKNDQ